MNEPPIRFDDGAAYERFMGVWSRLAGERFLDWLQPKGGLSWLDVGCGNGAFSELIDERAAPARVEGIDPSAGQIAFARQRPMAASGARFEVGDAMALPFADASFDVATMALVIFFVPDPAKGVAEMKRVVRPGGLVASYGWELLDGGFPYAVLQDEMQAAGLEAMLPPSPEASRPARLVELWREAGLVDIETHEIAVQRRYADFDDFWTTARQGPRIAPRLSTVGDDVAARLAERLRARLGHEADGSVVCSARARAIRGRVA